MTTAKVDESSPVPPYEQLRSQLADAIRTGALAPGTRLPTVRQLAGDLGVAPNTVAKAYKALEADSLVRGQGRRGTVVNDTALLPKGERTELLANAAARYIAECRRLGGTADDAIKAVATAARYTH